MLPRVQTYSIFPSVVPADKRSVMTILSNEKTFIMPDGKTFQLTVIAVNCDDSYYNVQTHKTFEVAAQNGVLTFEYDFEGEQEYNVIMRYEEKVVDTFCVYSLNEDLYSLTPLKGDLHSHSFRSDGSRDAAAQAGHYREQGYDFSALTDHNRYYSGGEITDTYEGVNTGFTVVTGEEVHSPGSPIHIVHVGGKESVAARYIHDRENYDKTIEEYMGKVPASVPEKYRERYAKAMWATDAIHEVGGLAIFPHPLWRPGKSKIYNVCTEFASILLKSGMFDAFELIGGVSQPDLNRTLALYNDLRAEGLKISVVASSDSHSIENSVHFPHKFTICFAKENTNDAIIEAVKNGMCVAVEATGYEYDRHYRCYGSYRLVAYAQFLLAYYFPKTQRASMGAGVAMRAYAMDDTDASLIEANTEIAEKLTARFFGRVAPTYPSEKLLAFEDKWRAIQIEKGPKTRGSSVDATPSKSLI